MERLKKLTIYDFHLDKKVRVFGLSFLNRLVHLLILEEDYWRRVCFCQAGLPFLVILLQSFTKES